MSKILNAEHKESLSWLEISWDPGWTRTAVTVLDSGKTERNNFFRDWKCDTVEEFSTKNVSSAVDLCKYVWPYGLYNICDLYLIFCENLGVGIILFWTWLLFGSGKGRCNLLYSTERNLDICLQGLIWVTFRTFMSGQKNRIDFASWLFRKPAGIGMKKMERDDTPCLFQIL